MDAFSRKVLGWALADHLQASLPLEALDKAIASRGGSPNAPLASGQSLSP
jgi:transposase InsO family protein